MENEIKSTGQNPVKKNKLIKAGVITLTSLFLIYYVTLAVLAPFKTITTIENAFKFEDTILIQLMNIDEYADSLARLSSQIKSRIEAAELDSINCLINMKDCTINLELEGVTIHSAKITKMEYSEIFNRINHESKYAYLSTPFYSISYISTIPKVPIVVKNAPRDTAEANMMNTVPVPPPVDYVNYTFLFDKPLRLTISQNEPPAEHHRYSSYKNRLGSQANYVKSIFQSAVRFQVPEYTPWITIEVKQDDAKTIFRALPQNAALVLVMD
ncbi:MAG: hypothetical protein HC906_04680 [Bacteroidales bacterium]|nr:hypothetical protein [Bacteroidales bacterium]